MSFAQSMRRADETLLKTFGDLLFVADKEILAVLDEDLYQKRKPRKQADYAEGIWTAGVMLICREADLGFRPKTGSLLTVSGKEWIVSEVSQGEGLLEITLEANEA
jgi:hypothetical protein